jgi:hypothetical protein
MGLLLVGLADNGELVFYPYSLSSFSPVFLPAVFGVNKLTNIVWRSTGHKQCVRVQRLVDAVTSSRTVRIDEAV